MTGVLITVSGEDVAALHLEEMAARTLDLRPAFSQVRRDLIAGNRRQFESRGSYFGSGWAPLADSTVARTGGEEPLVDSGALRASLIGGRGRKTSVDRSGVSVGTSVWYAHFAHSGTQREPARSLVGITELEVESAKRTISRYVTDGIVA